MAIAVFALMTATAFAAAALYISLVEHPARLKLDHAGMLRQWQPSYRTALPIQSGLAILGGVLGIVAGWHTRDWRWFAGAGVLLANWPFTLLVIWPTNKALLAMSAADAGARSTTLINDWGRLHAVRSGLGCLAAAAYAWAILAA